jgi:phosphoribosylanthranilate isomerase
VPEPRVRVKICGITRREDAELAARLGADYLGLIFVPGTPRFVTPEHAAEILGFAPHPPAIGVFMDAAADEIRQTVERVGLAGVQLHGDESPEECSDMPGFRIKTFRVRGAESLARCDEYDTEAVLCDTHVEGLAGGTGRAFDHGLVVELARRRRLFLSGGLNPDNVVAAARLVRPWAVDVASGVERAPGIKDPAKLEIFFARLAEAGLR